LSKGDWAWRYLTGCRALSAKVLIDPSQQDVLARKICFPLMTFVLCTAEALPGMAGMPGNW
jgi:hypothetical protein